MSTLPTHRKWQRTDITHNKIEQWFGRSFTQNKKYSDKYHYIAQVNKDWKIAVDIKKENARSNTFFVFDFFTVDSSLIKRPPLTEVCTIDLNDVHNTLLEAGYKGGDVINQRLGLSREYTRNNIFVDIWYAGESSENVTHDCIQRVMVKTIGDDNE